ncbi:MAG: ABC transporter permease subunit [Longimicrobiales bacterium]|nr:ABC transporter permease subunit [Longimicrobiales bacterium]
MNTTLKVLRYQLRHLLRTRALIGYLAFFGLATGGLLHFGGSAARALPSLATLTLLVVPLVSLVFTTIHLFEQRRFTQLLLSHPVGRSPLFAGMYLGVTLPLVGVFLAGVGLPLLWWWPGVEMIGPVLLILCAGALLTAVFTALAFGIAVRIREPARGLGVALLVWLGLTVLYDGVVLMASHALAAWPLEKPMLIAMLVNPVDLARVVTLMALDASAMLGYTGAVFRAFFGSAGGIALALGSLVVWVIGPVLLALRRFRRMDL